MFSASLAKKKILNGNGFVMLSDSQTQADPSNILASRP
jgi:hypothetical protein